LPKIAKIVGSAVKPGGRYSHAVIAGSLVYVSCQGPVDPASGAIPQAFEDQVRQCIRNVQTILNGVGSDLQHAVKINAYLADVSQFAEFDAAYAEFFPAEPPARTTIGCDLDHAMIEMDCVAMLPDPDVH
jgi:2-iminobutanoate/2-iminopropanoate deaminase